MIGNEQDFETTSMRFNEMLCTAYPQRCALWLRHFQTHARAHLVRRAPPTARSKSGHDHSHNERSDFRATSVNVLGRLILPCGWRITKLFRKAQSCACAWT